ncbi:MAG: CshA/CshB family fibrillar adhesin-related protein, partial [Propionibacteriaceae bacterium]|nr:CshA/CshB family fibrillar adhesin-related protein [Propionibacteriaceae bacterium]
MARKSGRRLVALTAVTALVAGAVGVTPWVLAPPAQAQYATGGSGLYKGLINWMPWGQATPGVGTGQADVQLGVGSVSQTSQAVGASTLTTRCTITAVSADDNAGNIWSYKSGTWWGDALDDLYNIGGVSTSNQLVYGISNGTPTTTRPRNPGSMFFSVTCTANLDGANVPIKGLVIADAEQNNHTTAEVERIAAQPETADIGLASWHMIERFRAPNCTTSTIAHIDTTNQRLDLNSSAEQCQPGTGNGGPIALGYMEGVQRGKFVVNSGTGNVSAVAIGVMLGVDYSDAPASYGTAGALYQGEFNGGNLVNGDNDVFNMTLATLGQPTMRLGATVTSDGAPMNSADASADSGDDGAVIQPRQDTQAGQQLTGPVTCSGAGTIAGWIDFNGNGVFDDSEKSAQVACPSSGTTTLTWTVPNDAKSQLQSFMRLRTAPSGTILAPTGVTLAGEVEDYALPQVLVNDFGDAPASYGVARHLLVNYKSTYTAPIMLGNTVDAEPAGLTSSDASGDDANTTDDETGVSQAISLSDHDTTYSLPVSVTNTSGAAATLVGWIDFNGDGSFGTDERKTVSFTATGTQTLSWTVPTTVKAGATFARFRVLPGTVTGASATDTITGGEVEDYPVTITATPSIGLTKTNTLNDEDTDRLADVGETISYSFVITNSGTANLTTVGITDPKVGAVTCPATTLAAAASMTCTAVYAVTQADIDAGSIVNTATAQGTGAGSTVTSPAATTTTPVDRRNGITLTKQALLNETNGLANAQVGETISYSFVITNSGTATVTAPTVTDPKAGTVTCPSAPIAPRNSATCTATYTVTQADLDTGAQITNTATASATGADGKTVSSDPATAVVATGRTAALTIDKTASLSDTDSDQKADLGESVTYSFVITNSGNVTVTAPTVTDAKLAAVTCPSGALAPGASVTCTASYTVTQADLDAGSVTNSATATATPPSGLARPVSTPDDTALPTDSTTGLTLAKEATLDDIDDDDLADMGESITYTFTVTNTGSQTLHGLTINDSRVSAVSCPTTTLGPKLSVECTATYTPTQNDIDTGSILNQANASALTPANTVVNTTTDQAIVSTDRQAALALTKVSALQDGNDNQLADVGETINYTITVTNTGTVTLVNVAVTDPKAAPVTCPQTTLAPQAQTVCTATYTVTQADLNAGVITNTASANATPPVGVTPPTSPTGTAVTEVNVEHGLNLTKTAHLNDSDGDDLADVGETVDYAFTVTNSGTVSLSQVAISDAHLTEQNIIISCAATALEPGASTTCAGRGYVVRQAEVDAGSVNNLAYATATAADGTSTTSGNQTTSVPAAQNASQELTKTADLADTNGNGVADAGETITYQFEAANTGQVSLHGFVLNDPALQAAGVTPSCGGTATGGGVGTVAVCSAVYVVTQADIDAGTVTNTATGTAYDPKNRPVVTNDSTVVTPVNQTAAITVVKSAALNDQDKDQLADAGETIDYSFRVTNTGAVTLTDPVITDPKLTAAQVTPTCPAGTVAPGASVTCTATYTVTQVDVDAGAVTNSATATATPPNDLTPPVSPASETSTPTDTASGLTLAKTGVLNDADADQLADVGETMTYSFALTNTGQVSLTNPAVDDSRLSAAGGAVSCPAGAIAPGATVNCTATYTVTQADVDTGTVVNTATASAYDPTATAVISPPATDRQPTDMTPAISAVKRGQLNDADGDGLADVGETVAYSITVANTGTVTFTQASAVDRELAAAGLTVTCPNQTLAPGQSFVCTATAPVTQADMDAGEVANTAYAYGVCANGQTSTSPDSRVTLPVDTQAGVSLVKTAELIDSDSDQKADVGERINYSFAVTNTGQMTLSRLAVSDPKLAAADVTVACPT